MNGTSVYSKGTRILSQDLGQDLGRGSVYPVALKLGRRVSVKPLAREEYERGDSPLLREVRRSGGADGPASGSHSVRCDLRRTWS
jgi:hypothetical protein